MIQMPLVYHGIASYGYLYGRTNCYGSNAGKKGLHPGPVYFILKRAGTPRHFLPVKGHPMRKL